MCDAEWVMNFCSYARARQVSTERRSYSGFSSSPWLWLLISEKAEVLVWCGALRCCCSFSRSPQVMKKSVIGPEFEKKDAVPPYSESKQALKIKRRVSLQASLLVNHLYCVWRRILISPKLIGTDFPRRSGRNQQETAGSTWRRLSSPRSWKEISMSWKWEAPWIPKGSTRRMTETAFLSIFRLVITCHIFLRKQIFIPCIDCNGLHLHKLAHFRCIKILIHFAIILYLALHCVLQY